MKAKIKKKKILFIGPYIPPVSGPAVKNSLMFSWLSNSNKESTYTFKSFNTNDFRSKKLLSIFKSIFLFITTKRIILSVSKNGRFIFIPICFIFRKKVLLFPAGGSFDEEINYLGRIRKRLFLLSCNIINKIYVETRKLKVGLEKIGFENALYLPNLRKNEGFKVSSEDDLINFKIIFLSKIRKGKGVILLVDAVKVLRERISNRKITLNFYGLVDRKFEDEFLSLIKDEPLINYKGFVDANDVQEIISKHDLFVLPSMFPEGVPGAVVEAMFTGIPIIISNFTAAPDLIEHNVDGLIIPQNNLEALISSIEDLILHTKKREKFSNAILSKTKSFDFDLMMPKFLDDLRKSAF